MKQKLFTFLCLCILCIGSAWAGTVTLTNAQIKDGSGSTSYGNCSATDGSGQTWNAYAIKDQHSKATSNYNYWQIKKYASNTAYYIQTPIFPGNITSITLTVSSSSKPMDGGDNSSTLYFSSSNSTAATGTGVAFGTGASEITINASSLGLKSGYITASGAIRIWEITVTYEEGNTPSISANNVNLEADATSGEITYTISNPVEGKTVSASTTADWISDINVGTEKVTFTTTANTGEERTADVTLTYDGATDKVVKVTQKEYVPVYAITLATGIVGGTIEASAAEAAAGNTISLTAHPSSGYALNEWSVKDADNNPITVTANKFTMPASNVTVSATFAEKTKFTVTYNALGEAAGTEDVYDGELIASAPTPTLADWEFTGWTTNKDYVMSAAAPAAFDLSTPITEDLTLYAVFQKTVNKVPTDFDLNVTSGDFTISYNGQYAASAIGSSSNGKISTSADSQTAYVYTFTKVSDGVYTIYDKTKEQYLKYKSSTDLDYAADAYNWSISASKNESGCWRITSGTSGRALIYRTSNLFGGYSTTNVTSTGEYHDVNILGYSTATTYYTTAGILTQDIEISAAGWATACLPFNATITSNNATAYYVTGINKSSIEKTEANVIPAGTGILLKSNNGSEANVTFTQSIETADNTSKNMLKGSLTGETFNESGYTYYILSTGENGIGFYWDKTYEKDNTYKEGKAAECAAGKAVLAVQTGAGAPSFFTFDDATAINGISSMKASSVRYNLNGQAVGEDYKGIVIVNGKKMFNK